MKTALWIALVLTLQGQEAPKRAEGSAQAQVLARQFVEASGVRARLAGAAPEMIAQGKAAMEKQCVECGPEFIREWSTRMAARMKTDDFVAVAVRAYARHFTVAELGELVKLAEAQRVGKAGPVSAELQKKMLESAPALMGEVTGGCTEVGARLGAQIGSEIEREHPEYLRAKPKR